MEIKQQLLSSSMYDIKCPYTMTPKGITVHNTANDASAKNEVAYAKSNSNEVSYHIAVDDLEAIQWIPFTRNAWHAGDGGSGFGNRETIAVEVCYSKSGGERFTKAEKNAAQVVAQLLKQFGWGFDKVYTHQRHSGKYCPHKTLDLGWDRFMNMVKAAYNGTSSTTISSSSTTTSTSGTIYRVRKTWADSKSQIFASKTFEGAKAQCKVGYSVFDGNGKCLYTNPPAQSTTTTTSGTDEVSRYAENGVFYPNTKIYFRNAPSVTDSNPIIDSYKSGESVKYDTVVIGKRYNWISWISASTGIRRYMPIKDKQTGESWGVAK